MAGMPIVFMGTPELACASLAALMAAPNLRIVGVVTQPDRPKGRDLKLSPSPVKELALRAGLPVLQPERVRHEGFLSELRALVPDLIAVAAFGQILPRAILDLPRFGCLNVHTSLLPKYRGAAPIQWAILNGEAETGVTIMKMDEGLDTGAILGQVRTPIHDQDNSETLHDRLAGLGARLLVQTVERLVAGELSPVPQPAEGATLAPKIKKQDGRLSWNEPCLSLCNRVRGLTPWPGAFTFLPSQPRTHLLKIWLAEPADMSGAAGEVLRADNSGIYVACGLGSLRILTVQLEGGRRLSAAQFLAGHPLKPGQVIG
jgi:methionyl-tRNA formyltransferase